MNFKNSTKIATQSALNTILGLLWLLPIAIWVNGFDVLNDLSQLLLTITGLMIWFFIFVFIPVFLFSLFALEFQKFKRIKTLLQTNKGLLFTVLLLLLYVCIYNLLDKSNDLVLILFLVLISLFSISLTLRKFYKAG